MPALRRGAERRRGAGLSAAAKAARARAAALRLVGAVALAVIVVDRATKWLVVEVMDLGHRLAIEVLPPYLNLVMAWNTGINFGLFSDNDGWLRWVLVGLAVAVSIALTVWSARRGGRLVPIASGVVIGGALGNAWDRVQYGAVADFLNMSCCGIDNPYAFNVADVAIFAGAMLLAWKA